MTGWVPDVLPGYWQHTIPLGPDPHGEGDIAATLVRRGEPTKTDHAVLAVHGYTDYFFNAALADHFAERGFAFYALDMHKCGRSWRAGQTPHFATDLADYDRELDSALAVIRAQSGPPTVLVYGHSTGGLIVSLWLDRLRRRGATAQAGIGGLVLNSPWLDLHGSPVLRWAVTSVLIAAVARLHGKGVARAPGAGGYGQLTVKDSNNEDPRPRRGRIRRQLASGLPRRVRLQPAVETPGRLSDHLRLAPRCPARPGSAASRARRRRAEPDPALGPQRRRKRRPDHAAMR
ncbi:hypothetical protein MXEN_03589 [Mycobacterium xenopi RIVM700367]|nr:alpha/beta hydrolase [Mycobacterium xenopi]EID16676.1 hypothetical protein MXEN_03589 [Mycobacterium xenopi RIVM700367]